MALVVITGMSGAGKSRAMNILEDMGYYCVDNLPPRFLLSFADLYGLTENKESKKIATVVDVRGKDMFADFFHALTLLRQRNYPYQILFLDAETQVLLKRYKETRRVHPLTEYDGLTLEDAIAQERKLMERTRECADYVIDTSRLLPAQLKERMVAILAGEDCLKTMLVQVLSFGYKNGLPAAADLVFDVRCLPNPFYDERLRAHTGREDCVRSYLMGFQESVDYLNRIIALIDFLLPLYRREGKGQLVVAFGCTGGKHRSVAFAEQLFEHLKGSGYRALLEHRDIESGRHGVPPIR